MTRSVLLQYNQSTASASRGNTYGGSVDGPMRGPSQHQQQQHQRRISERRADPPQTTGVSSGSSGDAKQLAAGEISISLSELANMPVQVSIV